MLSGERGLRKSLPGSLSAAGGSGDGCRRRGVDVLEDVIAVA